MRPRNLAAFLSSIFLVGSLHADNARFDLTGPKIDMRVTRGGISLPIAEVPNLQPGDKLWIKADLPSSQSNHLLLIVAFLRGTTNEPPDNWFTEIDTWEKKTVEGTTVVVPPDAQQALLFIAPETGGDFKTLRSAVKGKPGLFIRADADLNEASFEQQRIERYLAAMKTVAGDDPKAIQDRSAKLAATLALKPNATCFKQPVDQQVSCLTQSSAPVLLDDGHGQSIAESLSTGSSSDFINAASTTPLAGAGVYSAYVGAIVDLVHLTSLLHTAQYEYIPAISFPQDGTLNLKLNAPPSFHNPKSVIVVGLPAIQKAVPPPLRPHDADQVACLLRPKLTLPLEGAPLVFSTSFAHNMVLHLNRTGAPANIPLIPDAFEGGLVTAPKENREPLYEGAPEAAATGKAGVGTISARPATSTDLIVTGTVRGYWGFDPFDGPTLTLQQVAGKNWRITSTAQMLAGQDNHLILAGDGTACVQHIALTSKQDESVDVSFKLAPGGDAKAKTPLDLNVSLKKVQPGGYALAIQQFGTAKPDDVPLVAYTGEIHLGALKLHEGDNTAVLTGEHLEDVVSVQIADETFTPSGTGNTGDMVHLEAKTGVSPKDGTDASVKLKDGRSVTVKVSTQAARPALKLLSFDDKPAPSQGSLQIQLGAKEELPLRGELSFVVQTKNPFPRTGTVEVATADGSVHTTLSVAANTLVLQDEHTAIGRLDPLKAFGPSAFGKLQMRPVAADGTPGDWTPLGTLVRTPEITAVHCSAMGDATCILDGSNLFLAQAFAGTKDFAKPTPVPTGFAEGTLIVPAPADGSTLYMKLRDDPQALATITLPARPATAPPVAPAPGTGTAGIPQTTAQPASMAQSVVTSKEGPAVPPASAVSAKPSPDHTTTPQP